MDELPERCLKILNETNGASDHNVVSVEIAAREVRVSGNTCVKRTWKNFRQAECLNEFRRRDWSDISRENNVDTANSLLENRICEIMDMFAPMVTIQIRSKYKNFITQETKDCMKSRDMARELARDSGNAEDWDTFRRLRNDCTMRQRNDKKKTSEGYL